MHKEWKGSKAQWLMPERKGSSCPSSKVASSRRRRSTEDAATKVAAKRVSDLPDRSPAVDVDVGESYFGSGPTSAGVET
jgi:hypothetical protein